MENKIREIMSDILDVPEEDIVEEFGPVDAQAWDSLNNLRLVTALEEAFSIRLSMKDIREMTTFAAIRDKITTCCNEP